MIKDILVSMVIAILVTYGLFMILKPTSRPCDWEVYILMLHLEKQHSIYIDDLALAEECKNYWGSNKRNAS